MTWKALIALAILGAATSPASAETPRGTINRDGDRIAAMPVNDDAAAPSRLEGRVLAIDPQHGSFLLGTDSGMIALRADPEDLALLQVGQTLEIEMIDDK